MATMYASNAAAADDAVAFGVHYDPGVAGVRSRWRTF
jgi:hypothetical protein